MSDLFHRLNPFRPPSPTKPLRISSPTRKRPKTPLDLTLSRPDSTGPAPARPSSSLESPLPDVHNGRYLFDTQRSIDLDRPVFTPLPPSPFPAQAYQPVTPGRKGKTPSILRSLAHHPSLSALKGKAKREKAQKAFEEYIDGDREERLSGSIDEEVPYRDEEVQRGWMGTWGSGKKKKGRKGSLKAIKSMPSGLRSSGESNDYRSSIEAPVPALPEMYVKRSHTREIDFSKSPGQDIEIQLEGYETPVSPTRLAPRSSPSPLLRRTRGKSEDLSPRRQTPPRHLSTPASGGKSHTVSPPRFSLPPTTQHPHPVPQEWRRRDSIDEYDPNEYGDKPRSDLDNGLDMLRPLEELPGGTPGGSKEDKRRGLLSDGAKHDKGSIRFFSRDTYTRLSESPSESPHSTPRPTPTLAAPHPGLSDRAARSESPFEVKLSPMVTKRMSLDAFGPTSSAEDKRESMQSLPESIEEIQDETPYEVDDDQPVVLELQNTLEGWTGTQLTTIDESPASAKSAAFVNTPAPVQYGVPGTGKTAWYTPDSAPSPCPDMGIRKHSSYPAPTSLSRQLIEAHTEHTRSLDAQVRASEATIAELRQVVIDLKRDLEAESGENEAAWKVVDDLQAQLKDVEGKMEEKHLALEQMRQAMVENEEFFDQLQEAHDSLAERFARMELALSDNTILCEKQSEEIVLLTRAKDDVGLRLAMAEKRNTDLQSELQYTTAQLQSKIEERQNAAHQMEVTVEEYTSHMTICDQRMAETTARLVEMDAAKSLLSLRESEIQAKQAEIADLTAEIKVWKGKVAERDSVVLQLREKSGTKQFEMDEMRVEMEVEVEGMRRSLEAMEGEKQALVLEVENQEWSSPDEVEKDQEMLLELQAYIDMLRTQLSLAQNQLELADSELEAKVGDMSLQQSETDQLRAELEATQENLSRMTAQAARQNREHDRTVTDLQWQIDDLRCQLSDSQNQVRAAFVEREMSSATTADVQSRLTAYLTEIDRLKMSEASLSSELTDLRLASSRDTMRTAELEKRVKELEEDKELLDISLDNKQTEITLLHRQASRSGSVTPNKKRLVASTSRIPSTPSTAIRGDIISGANKRLSISMHESARPASAGSVKARRESIIMPTPGSVKGTPVVPAGLTRRPSITTPTPASRAVLGSSTKHNRGEARPTGPRKTIANTVGTPGLKRQTSLPTLGRASSVSRSSQRTLDGMAEVDEN